MNRQQFSDFVKNPGKTNAQSLKMLEDLVRRYPYCQSGQLLYTYNLFREENLQYPLQLKKAAAYASDRKILKELIDSAKNKVTRPALPDSITTEPLVAEAPEASEDHIAPTPVPMTMPAIEVFSLPSTRDRLTPEELLLIVKRRLAEINAQKEPTALSIKTKESIIEKFILEEPKISRPKAAFFNPTDSAIQSNFDDEEIVSETLAKLYASQGNIPKAIHIYQKLSLLNQEKSRYFAARIANLKS